MRQLISDSLRLIAIQQDDRDANHPNGNFVVYPLVNGRPDFSRPLFDEWLWLASLGETPAPGPNPDPSGPTPVPAPPSGPTPSLSGGGGIPLLSDDSGSRPRLSAQEIRQAVRADPGAFTFPAPWSTLGVRLTSSQQGTFYPNGYGYWGKINAHGSRGELCAVIGRVDAPALLMVVDKRTLAVRYVELSNLYGTGEQWYFDSHDPDILFITEPTGLLRYNIASGQRSEAFRAPDGHSLWQCHSSEDGQTHSATLKALPGYNDVAAIVARSGGVIHRYDITGAYDECQVDRTGQWNVIKIGNDNLMIEVATDKHWAITNAGHAIGHSDTGRGYAVGEDDYNDQPGAFVKWWLPTDGPHTVYHMTDWQEMSRDISHCNVGQDWVLISAACRNNVPRSNELVKAWIDGSMRCTAIAPNLVDLDTWMPGDDALGTQREKDYRKLPMANVCPHGEWAFWTANCGTSRFDAFLVRIP